MTLGSFTCPLTHPPGRAFTTHRSYWRNMKISRSQQRYVCVHLSVYLSIKGGRACLQFFSYLLLTGCVACIFAQSHPLLWGPFPGRHIVLFPLYCVAVIMLGSSLLCPSGNTLFPNTLSLFLCHLPFLCMAIPLHSVPPPSLLTANQRAGKAVDPAGGWVLWQGPRPCLGNKEMGVLGGQALQGLLSPHGQIPNLPGISTWHFFRLKQSRECPSLITPYLIFQAALKMKLHEYMCICEI